MPSAWHHTVVSDNSQSFLFKRTLANVAARRHAFVANEVWAAGHDVRPAWAVSHHPHGGGLIEWNPAWKR
jgi:hypothetical protein